MHFCQYLVFDFGFVQLIKTQQRSFGLQLSANAAEKEKRCVHLFQQLIRLETFVTVKVTTYLFVKVIVLHF